MDINSPQLVHYDSTNELLATPILSGYEEINKKSEKKKDPEKSNAIS